MIDFDFCETCNSDKVNSFAVVTNKAVTWLSACDSCGVKVEVGTIKKEA